jgi:hypothetical protein
MMNIAILDTRPAVTPGALRRHNTAVDLARVFALDSMPQSRVLACRWRRNADGRFACILEPGIGPVSQA